MLSATVQVPYLQIWKKSLRESFKELAGEALKCPGAVRPSKKRLFRCAYGTGASLKCAYPEQAQ